MQRERPMENKGWRIVQSNPTYLAGSLRDEEGEKIKWHSPAEPASSQVFCVSAFGKLRSMPDGVHVTNQLITDAFPYIRPAERWEVTLEHANGQVLGETGQGTPTTIDVFLESPTAVVCVEAKLLYDAREGFGGCGQYRQQHCAGFFGPGSDLMSTQSESWCRLQSREGKRDSRSYWALGRAYFQDHVFRAQRVGQECPFAGPHYQLMRNFLFAATSAGAGREFAVLAIVPKSTAAAVRKQVSSFQDHVLLPQFRARIDVATYDTFAVMMTSSVHRETEELGRFLQKRISELT